MEIEGLGDAWAVSVRSGADRAHGDGLPRQWAAERKPHIRLRDALGWLKCDRSRQGLTVATAMSTAAAAAGTWGRRSGFDATLHGALNQLRGFGP